MNLNTVAGAASAAGISEREVRSLIAAGRLDVTRLDGRIFLDAAQLSRLVRMVDSRNRRRERDRGIGVRDGGEE